MFEKNYLGTNNFIIIIYFQLKFTLSLLYLLIFLLLLCFYKIYFNAEYECCCEQKTSLNCFVFCNCVFFYRSNECDLVRGECTQTYVPYLFLVIPLGPVTLTGQDYVLVESGCVCKPKGSTRATAHELVATIPAMPHP